MTCINIKPLATANMQKYGLTPDRKILNSRRIGKTFR